MVSAVGVVFHIERREWVFARDFLRLGTATVVSYGLLLMVCAYAGGTPYLSVLPNFSCSPAQRGSICSWV